MDKKNVLTVIVEKTGTGFSAYAKEIDGLITVADTISELKDNFNEVFEIHLDFLSEKEGSLLKKEDFTINYAIDLEQFFEYFSVINKTAFAEKYAKVNTSLFRQYTKGLAPLSGDKLKQISDGLHKLADEINDLQFA